MADVNLVSIIMHSGNQSNFVAADIEDREFPDLIGVRKGLAQLREIEKPAFSHNRVPTRNRRFGVRVFFANSFKRFRVMTCIIGARPYLELFLMRSQKKIKKEELGKNAIDVFFGWSNSAKYRGTRAI
jgi:hypothetical protein